MTVNRFALDRLREQLSGTIRDANLHGPDSGATHVVVNADGFVLSAVSGSWSRSLREALSANPGQASPVAGGEVVTVREGRERLVDALEVELAAISETLRMHGGG